MKCPTCGGPLKPSKKDPDYLLCYTCKKKFKVPQHQAEDVAPKTERMSAKKEAGRRDSAKKDSARKGQWKEGTFCKRTEVFQYSAKGST